MKISWSIHGAINRTIIPLWVLHHNVTEIWVVNVPMMLMLKPTMSPHDLEWPIAHQDCSSGKCSNVIWTKVCLSAQLHLSMWYHHLHILSRLLKSNSAHNMTATSFYECHNKSNGIFTENPMMQNIMDFNVYCTNITCKMSQLRSNVQ